MGAWGYGLFQSDYDYDIVADLSAECGLDKLQSDAEAKSEGSESTSEDAAPEFYYSLYCPSDVEVVREHLETPGAATGVSPLDSALSKWEAKAFGKRPKYEYPDSGYAFVLLGACAMTLGCKLSPVTLQNMRKMFTKCGLMPDALTQMDAALNGPGSYKGEPWHFNSPGLLETANSRFGGGGGGGGLNVPAPHGMFKGPDDSRLVAKIEARMAAYALEKDDRDICGAADCQATHSNAGRALLVCSKCKERKYCSKDCQAKHWKSHKLVCIKAA